MKIWTRTIHPSWECEVRCLEITFEISEPLWEQLLMQAAETEITVEEIVINAIQNYMKRGGNNAD